MISPEKFRANEFTMDDNVFQSRKIVDSEVSIQALEEFEKLKNTISDNGVSVYSIMDDSLHDTPDAVFPNNWISFHHKNNAVIYPMFAANNNFSIICLESIKNLDEKNNLIKSLENSELDIIDISYDQMCSYLGNCIQLVDKELSPKLVMSTSAFKSIKSNQLSRILKHTEIIHSDIKTIEKYGGGSARCMIAEIF